MIRSVGETFKYGKVTLRVVKDTYPYCIGCYFRFPESLCVNRDRKKTGACGGIIKSEPWVRFVKVEEGGVE